VSALQPWQLLLITLAGWVERHQQDIIEYLVERNRVLEGQLRGRRLRLTDDERRRLAAKGRALGRQVLERIATVVTPVTIPAWYPRLPARKWDYSNRRKPGRPRTRTDIAAFVVRTARENPTWGYTRIQGASPAHVGLALRHGERVDVDTTRVRGVRRVSATLIDSKRGNADPFGRRLDPIFVDPRREDRLRRGTFSRS